MMLMGWGPFRFTVPNYSVEDLKRSCQPRISPQPVIGAVPPLHKLGPGNDTVTLSSTFHPHHLNGGGLAQLAGVREAVRTMVPMSLVGITGQNIFGLWAGTGLEEGSSQFDYNGTPAEVTVQLTLMAEGGSDARIIALGSYLESVGFDLNIGLGF